MFASRGITEFDWQKTLTGRPLTLKADRISRQPGKIPLTLASDYQQPLLRRPHALRYRPPMTGWVASAAAFGVLLQTASPSVSPLDAIDKDISAGVYGNVDRLYVMRKGDIIADHSYPRDYRAISRGRIGPIGCGDGCADANWKHEFNYFDPDTHPYYKGRDIHTLQSVTKSIAATAIGIALGRGEIRSLDQPFLEHFGDKDLSRIDPRLRTATIADVLTMRSGIEWHEQDRPLGDTNTTIQLERSRDWIQFTLDQPMDAEFTFSTSND